MDASAHRITLHGWRWDTRLAWARTLPAGPAPTATSPGLRRWQERVAPYGGGQFARRLALAGLDMARAEQMLAATAVPPAEDQGWQEDLQRLRAACQSRPASPPGHLAAIPFAHLLWTIVEAQAAHTLGALPDAVRAHLGPAAREAACCGLLDLLSTRFARALNANCMAERGAGIELMLQVGALEGAGSTPPVRYPAFCRDQLATGLASLLDQYPVLGRLLGITCRQWGGALAELLERVHADQAALVARWSLTPGCRITTLRWGLSDPHHGNRTVVRLTFAAPGTDVAVIYKPKDIRIEAAFQQLLQEVWRGCDGSPAPALVVLSREGYGYVAEVRHAPCRSPEELAAFYRNAGRLLAVLYLTGATDCHCDNLIACGTMPTLVDVETLFHHGESVTDTMLLPTWAAMGGRAVDVGALGLGAPPPREEHPYGWLYPNTDDMVWTRVPSPPADVLHLPVPSGMPSPFPSHLEEVVGGFTEAYHVLMDPARRVALRDRLEAFRGLTIRRLLRSTATYLTLQHQALAAEALGDARVRGIILDQLSRVGTVDTPQPGFPVMFATELREMEDLDIPLFSITLGEPPAVPLPGLDADDGLAAALARLDQLSSRDLEGQVRLIRASVEVGRLTGHTAAPVASGSPSDRQDQPSAADPGRRDRAVASIEATLCHTHLPTRTGAPTWLTAVPVAATGAWRVAMAPAGLYDGVSGIATFLHALAQRDASQQVEAGRLADAAMAPVLNAVHQSTRERRHHLLRDIGLGHSGVGGVLRACLALGHTPAARALAHLITGEWIARDRERDVIGGVAGLIGPLARMHRDTPDDAVAAALGRAARHLLAGQDPESGAWPSPDGRPPMTGLSHGASGMGLALIEAGVALGDSALVDAGARAFRYEDSVRDPDTGLWPDYRDASSRGAPRVAWCHGAAGIALARTRALALAPDHPDRDHWQQALDLGATAILAAPLLHVDDLCCGNLGRAAILHLLAAHTDTPAWHAAADAITERVLARADRGNHFAWALGGFESPTLMRGLSGLGLHLLGAPARATLASLLT